MNVSLVRFEFGAQNQDVKFWKGFLEVGGSWNVIFSLT